MSSQDKYVRGDLEGISHCTSDALESRTYSQMPTPREDSDNKARHDFVGDRNQYSDLKNYM